MTGDEARSFRETLHAQGYRELGFHRFVGDQHVRIAETYDGRTFIARHHHEFGWSRWKPAYTHSFDRFVRHMGLLK